MEPTIQALLDEVPSDFVPTMAPKAAHERLVGTLDDLDSESQRLVRGALYFLGISDAMIRHGDLEGLAHVLEKVEALQEASGASVLAAFRLEPNEGVSFRAEGVVAYVPEPEDALMATLMDFEDRLGGITPGGPDGSSDVAGTVPEPEQSDAGPDEPAKRSIVDRLLRG